MQTNSPTGNIFDIHRFSIHDGPGIRTTIFFKGCPLSCWWCHNPESQSSQSEKIMHYSRCIQCGACVAVCPQSCLSMIANKLSYDASDCKLCGQCIDVCTAEAAEIIGEEKTVDEVIALINRDRIYYDESGGGVTFSGGEPLSQPAFLAETMKTVSSLGIHTALDTSGYAPFSSFKNILPYTDLVLYDLKLMDDVKHKEVTGVSNRLILENLTRIDDTGVKFWLRFPVIPVINDNEENLLLLAQQAQQLDNLDKLSLLPFHKTANKKYEELKKSNWCDDIEPLTSEAMAALKLFFEDKGILTEIGG